jgi:hypothetical protein
VRRHLLDGPRFLWVSDGKSFWGREAMLERMASFQEAEVWQVDPDLEKAVAVEIGPETGYLHLPLQLTIGAKTSGSAALPRQHGRREDARRLAHRGALHDRREAEVSG